MREWMGQAILLHFLDRELRESVHFDQNDEYCKHILMCSLFMADSIFTVVTHGIENCIELPKTTNYLNQLSDLGIIEPLARCFSAAELVVDRQKLYEYDKERYPFYFENNFEFHFPDNFIPVMGSTTNFIKDSLENMHPVQNKLSKVTQQKELLDYVVTKRLERFDGLGLTISSFNSIFSELNKRGIEELRSKAVKEQLNRELISFYNDRYIDLCKAHIIKSIPKIHIYDSIDPNGYFDYQIYSTILQPIFASYSLEQMEIILTEWKMQNGFTDIVELLDMLVKYIIEKYQMETPGYEYPFMIREIVIFLKRKIKGLKFDFSCFTKIEDIYSYLNMLKKELNFWFKKNERKVRKNKMHKILLPVANETEFKMIIEVVNALELDVRREIIGLNTFQIFEGEKYIGYIVKCEAGSSGSGASILTLTDAINNIGIDSIIFGGIAFGNYQKKKKEQNIGDILVSRQLWNYELGKESDCFIPRGDKVTAPPWMLDRFQNSAQKWKNSKVHFGLVASGEKLINSEDFIQKMIINEPEIIGGDMEGAGMVSVAERYKKDWILVKAISDWGIGKRDDKQKLAAENAFKYIFLTITEFMF